MWERDVSLLKVLRKSNDWVSRPKQDNYTISSKAWGTYGKNQPNEHDGAKDRKKGCGMLTTAPDSLLNHKDTEPAQEPAC